MDFPNLAAFAEGRTSGDIESPVLLRPEARAALRRLEELEARLAPDAIHRELEVALDLLRRGPSATLRVTIARDRAGVERALWAIETTTPSALLDPRPLLVR